MWVLPSLVRLRVEVVPSQGVWLPSRGGAVTNGREMIHLRLRLLGSREIVLTCHFGGKLVVKLVVEHVVRMSVPRLLGVALRRAEVVRLRAALVLSSRGA